MPIGCVFVFSYLEKVWCARDSQVFVRQTVRGLRTEDWNFGVPESARIARYHRCAAGSTGSHCGNGIFEVRPIEEQGFRKDTSIDCCNLK